MKKASLVIKEIQEGTYNDVLKEVYIDESRIEKQPQRYVAAIEKFISLYGDQEIEIYSTPGRSEVSGNHTDHQNGKVICSTINLNSRVSASVSENNIISIISENYGKIMIESDYKIIENSFSIISTKIIMGILMELNLVVVEKGVSIYINSNIPSGSGLGSSAAFSLSIIKSFNELYDKGLSDLDMAKISQKIENKYLGKNSGLMDQIACLHTGMIKIDFKNVEKPNIEKIDFNFSDFGYGVYIMNTEENHENLIDDYKQIFDEMKFVASYFNKKSLREVSYRKFTKNIDDISKKIPNRAVLRAYHYFMENARIDKFVELIRKRNDIEGILKLINESGASSSHFLQNYYVPKSQYRGLDIATMKMKILFNNEYLATKVCGGGFGGVLLVIVKNDDFSTINKLEKEDSLLRVL